MRRKEERTLAVMKVKQKTGVKAAGNNVSNRVSKVGILVEIKPLLLFGREKGEGRNS